MPLSANTYKGLGLPRHGNALLEGVSTADVLTIQHSTLDQGNFLVFRDSPASSLFPESTVDTLDVLRFGAGGGMTLFSTVLGEGAIAGFRRPVVESTVGRVLTITESGTLFVISSAVGTSMTFDLPVGPGVPGTWYEFWVSTATATGDVRISASSDVAAKIHGLGDTSIVSTYASITPENVLGSHFARLTAATSLLWIFENNGGYSSASTLSQLSWIAGSTAT